MLPALPIAPHRYISKSHTPTYRSSSRYPVGVPQRRYLYLPRWNAAHVGAAWLMAIMALDPQSSTVRLEIGNGRGAF